MTRIQWMMLLTSIFARCRFHEQLSDCHRLKSFCALRSISYDVCAELSGMLHFVWMLRRLPSVWGQICRYLWLNRSNSGLAVQGSNFVSAETRRDVPYHHLIHSVVRPQVHCLFQSQFSKQCYLVLPLSISCIFPLVTSSRRQSNSDRII